MKHIVAALACVVCSVIAYGQNSYSVEIKEDYTNPNSYMWEKSSNFYTGTIENGMYVSKAGDMHAQLKFGYSLYDRQGSCIKSSDMEYSIVKLKGNKESFMCVQIDPNGDKDYPYLVFQYNELGDWKLTNYIQDKTYSSGKTTVNPGTAANVIRIEHRYDKVSYFVNGTKVTELKAANTLEIRWYNNKIYSKDKKFVIGLDRALLGGCVSQTETKAPVPPPEAVMGLVPPDPNEVIDYNKVYEAEPDTDIIYFRDKFEKLGIKNLKGEVLCPPKFSVFEGFYGGVSFVWGEGGAALIDRTGKELTPYRYKDFKNFSEGVALVTTDCDENGEHCKYSYIDKTGKTVLELPAKYVSAGSFSDGLAVVSILFSGKGETMSDYRFGYIDITGKEVIPPTFYNAGDFRYNRAPVESSPEEHYKVGYINKTGKVVIPYKYYKMGEMNDYLFSEGLAAVFIKEGKVNNMDVFKHGYIDVNGKEVIPLKYFGASDFKDGVAVVSMATGKRTGMLEYSKKGLIDKTGKELTPIKYDAIGEFIEGLALVTINKPDADFVDKAGFIDRTGKEVIPLIYESATPFSEGLAHVEHSCDETYPYTCKHSYIDKTGKIVFTSQYGVDFMHDYFSEGLIIVMDCKEVDGENKCKYGYMDKTGKLVVPFKYDYAETFWGGLANVELDGKTFKIDKKGVEYRGGKNQYGEDE